MKPAFLRPACCERALAVSLKLRKTGAVSALPINAIVLVTIRSIQSTTTQCDAMAHHTRRQRTMCRGGRLWAPAGTPQDAGAWSGQEILTVVHRSRTLLPGLPISIRHHGLAQCGTWGASCCRMEGCTGESKSPRAAPDAAPRLRDFATMARGGGVTEGLGSVRRAVARSDFDVPGRTLAHRESSRGNPPSCRFSGYYRDHDDGHGPP